jgi:DNA-binding transcriptional regulator GbsR (MarR family)
VPSAGDTKLSTHTIDEHLGELLKERLIEKRKEMGHRREYRTTDRYLLSKLFFAHKMRRIGNKMINSIYQKPENLLKDITGENIDPSSKQTQIIITQTVRNLAIMTAIILDLQNTFILPVSSISITSKDMFWTYNTVELVIWQPAIVIKQPLISKDVFPTKLLT